VIRTPHRPSARKLLAAAAALGVCAVLAPGQAAAAAGSASRSATEVDPGPLEAATYGTAPWRSGSIRVTATRTADGRLAVRAQATIVARRGFVAQISIAPCNALRNPLSATPDVPILQFKGREVVAVKHLRPGANRLAVAGTVSSNAAGEAAPRNWTDCASAEVLDQQEEAATLAATPENSVRVNTVAFGIRSPVAMLTSTAADGSHD
jgi:hypothetical protein